MYTIDLQTVYKFQITPTYLGIKVPSTGNPKYKELKRCTPQCLTL
jgi:hypothetical protein